MSTKGKSDYLAPEKGKDAGSDTLVGGHAPEALDAPVAPAPENPAELHVPVEEGKGGCYVIGDDGRRVRVTP